MVNSEIKEISDLIALKSVNGTDFHPINRDFLEPYVRQILKLDKKSFLLYNIESQSPLYSNYLMLSLPELWENLTADDLIEIICQFENTLSYFSIISFTYKFVEVDIIKLILQLPSLKSETKKEIKTYLKNQYNTFFKTETDLFFFEQGLIGVKYDQWIYIKQRLLLNKKIEPTFESADELKQYVFSL